jgi:hypothetical protein
VSLGNATYDADHIVVATPVDVSFASMAEGEERQAKNWTAFPVRWRVDQVVSGDLAVGSVVTVLESRQGCEVWDVTLRKTDGVVVETSYFGERVLDPEAWMRVRRDGIGVPYLSDEGMVATTDWMAELARHTDWKPRKQRRWHRRRGW